MLQMEIGGKCEITDIEKYVYCLTLSLTLSQILEIFFLPCHEPTVGGARCQLHIS